MRDCRCANPATHAARRWNSACTPQLRMTITMGDLVCEIYEAYGRQLHDDRLAAIATEVRLVELAIPAPGSRRKAPRHRAK